MPIRGTYGRSDSRPSMRRLCAMPEPENSRHLVRHRHGIELDGKKVVESVDLVRRVFPDLVETIVEFKEALLVEPVEEGRLDHPKPA